MTKRLAVIVLMATAAGLISCDGTDRSDSRVDAGKPDSALVGTEGGPGAETGAATTPSPSAPDISATTARVPGPPVGAGEAIEGAPGFAVVFPGATVETTPLTTAAAGGNGGGVVFTSDASPDVIVDFYRRKAEVAGLDSIMSMNQGDTRAYGASGSGGGGSLQVVAHPVEPGRTSVQLMWTSRQ